MILISSSLSLEEYYCGDNMKIYVLIVSRSFHVIVRPLRSYILWGYFYSDFHLVFILLFRDSYLEC